MESQLPENQHSLILEFAPEEWREYFKERLDGPVQIVPREAINYVETIGVTTNDYLTIHMSPGAFVGARFFKVNMMSYRDPTEEAETLVRVNQFRSKEGFEPQKPVGRFAPEEVGRILAAREEAKQARIAEGAVKRHERLSDSKTRQFGRRVLQAAHLRVPKFLRPSERKFRRSDKIEKASINLARTIGEKFFGFQPLGERRRQVDILLYEGPDKEKIIFVAEESEAELREQIYNSIAPKSLQKTAA